LPRRRTDAALTIATVWLADVHGWGRSTIQGSFLTLAH
jgi:hypothetical protein